MFIDQSKSLPFPKVTPILLPEVASLANKHIKFYNNVSMSDLEDSFRSWYSPLVDIDQFPFMYFMNNGITQALEYMPIHYKNEKIKMLLGDYFWLKTIGSAVEVPAVEQCNISYDTNPSTIDGSIHTRIWNSNLHILDGAYVGTCLNKISIPNNTDILLLSFSKNLGLPDLRCGLLLSKKKIPTLHVLQKTFSYVGLHSFKAISNICKEISIVSLASKLKEYQLEFCGHMNDFIPSDSALLATSNNQDYKFYKRPNGIIRIPLGESITQWIVEKIHYNN